MDGPLLILAGAGSGKTRVIAYRIAYLDRRRPRATPDEVVAVTFTNKAAEEMRQRVEALLGDACAGAWISTFHALCARLLRREAPVIGLSRDFVIYDSSDQVSVDQAGDARAGHRRQPAAAARRALAHQPREEHDGGPGGRSRARARTRASEQIGEDLRGLPAGAARRATRSTSTTCCSRRSSCSSASDVRARYARPVQVPAGGRVPGHQPAAVPADPPHGRSHRNLCVVGDPDQSIYKWRGADLRNILDFESDFPETRVVRLERNYRSTQVILDAASAVISQNRNRKEKRL